MKKLLVILIVAIIALVVNFNAFAEYGNLSGTDWSLMDETEKEIYLKGLLDGMNFILLSIIDEEFYPIEDIGVKHIAENIVGQDGLLLLNQERLKFFIEKFDDNIYYYKDTPFLEEPFIYFLDGNFDIEDGSLEINDDVNE